MSIKIIEALSNAFGPSGFEHEARAVAADYVADFANTREDKIGNLFINYKKSPEQGVKILLDGHIDEVGFIVQAIRPNGMIEFLTLGGWVAHNVPAHQVIIKTEEGDKVKGIISSKPPHFMTDEERNQPFKIEDAVIDVGTTSKEETEALGIRIGDPVCPDVTFDTYHNDTILMGKGFDDRIGSACVLEVMKEFAKDAETATNVQIQGVLTAQEEVGTRGAQVVANNFDDIDLAISFEGCPADDTFTPEYKIQTALKKGPMLRDMDRSMITHPGFQKYALDLAKKHGLKVQRSVRSGGGTNGGIYHLAGKGVPTIVIGIPVRYAHTHYGLVAYEDFVAAKELGLAILRNMTPEIYEAL